MCIKFKDIKTILLYDGNTSIGIYSNVLEKLLETVKLFNTNRVNNVYEQILIDNKTYTIINNFDGTVTIKQKKYVDGIISSHKVVKFKIDSILNFLCGFKPNVFIGEI